jgi:hypothetical protein
MLYIFRPLDIHYVIFAIFTFTNTFKFNLWIALIGMSVKRLRFSFKLFGFDFDVRDVFHFNVGNHLPERHHFGELLIARTVVPNQLGKSTYTV